MSDDQSCEMPKGELALRVYAMPSDTNVYGQIFGGWVLGQMDIGGAIAAGQAAGGLRMVTVAVDAMKFHKPIHKGDEVTIYTRLGRLGPGKEGDAEQNDDAKQDLELTHH